MPKSRSRGRASARTQPPQAAQFRKWGKWLAAIPLIALLLATLMGMLGGTAAAVPINGSSGVPVQPINP
jgi:hypothetical protein